MGRVRGAGGPVGTGLRRLRSAVRPTMAATTAISTSTARGPGPEVLMPAEGLVSPLGAPPDSGPPGEATPVSGAAVAGGAAVTGGAAMTGGAAVTGGAA